jgi:uncharacterized phage infection (PIP) family protein YhgE
MTNNNSNNIDTSNKKPLIEQVKEKVATGVGKIFHRVVGKRVNNLLDNAVPRNLINLPVIKEKLQKVKGEIGDIQQKVINRVSKNSLDSLERDVYVAPVLGEVVAAVTSVDSMVAAARNGLDGFKRIKDKVNEVRDTVKQAKEQLASMKDAATVDNLPNIKVGGKTNYILNRTRKSIDRFHRKQRLQKTKKIDHILERTKRSIHRFHK